MSRVKRCIAVKEINIGYQDIGLNFYREQLSTSPEKTQTSLVACIFW
jgi:hypothetical protein